MKFYLSGATIDRRNGDREDAIRMGGGCTEKVLRGFIQFNKVVSENGIANLIPEVSGWRGWMIVQMESEFSPLGAPVGEVDCRIVF